MEEIHLYMLLLGCTPKGRHIEQHDIFFGIATSVRALVPAIIDFWPEAKGDIHIDAYREVNNVDGNIITIRRKDATTAPVTANSKLFFINLGGYKQNEFEEFHYKMIVAATDKGKAIQQAKQTAFYKHTGFKGAESHVDDKYGIDVDDIYAIEDILPAGDKEQYIIEITASPGAEEDKMNLGYYMLHKL